MPHSVFTVSGLPSSGKTAVARKLCEGLDLDYFSPGAHYNDMVLKNIMHVRDYKQLSREDEDVIVDEQQIERMRKGSVVIDGIYAAMLCYEEKIDAFHIFLQAPLKVRAQRIKEDGTDINEIVDKLARREEAEVEKGRDHYGMDYRNPQFYNMITDTTKTTPETVLKMVRARHHIHYNISLIPEVATE